MQKVQTKEKLKHKEAGKKEKRREEKDGGGGSWAKDEEVRGSEL